MNDRDIVIKLNTGGGKTLVGLLIAQAIINERQGPVLYLCPTGQLQGQNLGAVSTVRGSRQSLMWLVEVKTSLRTF